MPVPVAHRLVGELRATATPDWGRDPLNTYGLTYGHVGGLSLSPSTGLPVLTAAGTIALAPGAFNYVQRTLRGTVIVNQTGFDRAHIPMAKVETDLTQIINIQDFRPLGGAPLSEALTPYRVDVVPVFDEDDATDVSDAILDAIASHEVIQLEHGIYGVGATIFDNIRGHIILGAGIWNRYSGADQAGTKLLRVVDNGDPILRINDMHQCVQGLTIDGANLPGAGLQHEAINARVSHVAFERIGGTSYALNCEGTNLSLFEQLYFVDSIMGVSDPSTRSYGHIKMKNSLYSHFEKCSGGYTAGGQVLRLVNSVHITGKNNTWDSTAGNYQVMIDGNSQDIDFANSSFESMNDTHELILLSNTTQDGAAGAADLRGIRFPGLRVNQQIATTKAVAKVVGAQLVSFDDITLQDLVSPAGRPIFDLDGGFDLRFRGADLYHGNTFKFLRSIGARTDRIELTSVNSHSGAAGSLDIKASGVDMARSNLSVAFQAGSAGSHRFFFTGALDLTNAGGACSVSMSPITADPSRLISHGMGGYNIGGVDHGFTFVGMIEQEAQPDPGQDGAMIVWRKTSTGVMKVVIRGFGGQVLLLG